MDQPIWQLRCTMGHVFWFTAERREDVTTTMCAGFDTAGFALFRDRTIILCPVCKCPTRITGVNGQYEVKYTPAAEA